MENAHLCGDRFCRPAPRAITSHTNTKRSFPNYESVTCFHPPGIRRENVRDSHLHTVSKFLLSTTALLPAPRLRVTCSPAPSDAIPPPRALVRAAAGGGGAQSPAQSALHHRGSASGRPSALRSTRCSEGRTGGTQT